jgi:hypothetical protein
MSGGATQIVNCTKENESRLVSTNSFTSCVAGIFSSLSSFSEEESAEISLGFCMKVFLVKLWLGLKCWWKRKFVGIDWFKYKYTEPANSPTLSTMFRYHNIVCAALDFVCDAPVAAGEAPIPTDARLAFFNETRHSYGRTALLLSGGAALGFYHIGVVRTLMANRLMPRVLGGSSAGSILCAMIGTRTDEECERDLFEVRGTNAPGHSGGLAIQFFRPLEAKQLGANVPIGSDIGQVYRNNAGAFHDAKRTWQILVPIGLRRFTSTLFDLLTLKRRPQDLLMSDTEHFRECCRTNIGDFTFQEAFDRTGRIMNITGTSFCSFLSFFSTIPCNY